MSLNATGIEVNAALLSAILSGIDLTATVDEIIIDIRASLGIFEACLGLPPTPPIVNNVYVVWINGTGFATGDDETFFSASNDNGQTFSFPPDNLSNTTESSILQQITSEGNNVYVVWQAGFEILFAVSYRRSQTFRTS